MRTLTTLAIAVVMAATLGLSEAYAKEGTPDEAMALAKKAAAFVKEKGKDAAIAEFNKTTGQFIVDDLYVFSIDNKGVFSAHPVKPALVGKNMIDMKDLEGTPLIKLFAEVKPGEEKWVAYKWPHPETKAMRSKKSYIINVDGLILGVGAYY
jgi:signal transduction histidine kinase